MERTMDIKELAGQFVQALNLERPLVFLDLETTTPAEGVDPDARADRIVSIAVLKVYPDGLVTTFGTLVNPGQPITKATTDVHGITDDMVADAPTFQVIARAVWAGMSDSDVAGYNARRYDVPLLAAEFTRAGLVWDLAAVVVVDPYLLWAKMEPRDLTAYVRRFQGVAHEGAHDAQADVAAVVQGLMAMLDVFQALPRTVPGLAALCAKKANPNWLDPDGKIQWVDGVATVCFGKRYSGKPVAKVPTDFWEWILREDFTPEVKKIARNAIDGLYPTRALPLPLEGGAV
jgi:DNA polymerase III subunit epsilon